MLLEANDPLFLYMIRYQLVNHFLKHKCEDKSHLPQLRLFNFKDID